ncbi:MAG: SDR family oxidoreductase [Anaerolineae bacterium]|nr:SDR family oxidoreductase [Candidatus Roseilinea sp.]MDW8451402.1 SDR family oxidoreductase [Anaerolineae bacterium]
MNTLDLSNKIILITGGAGAIGQVVVRTLLAHGATIAVNDVVSAEDAKAVLPNADRVRYFRADAARAEEVAAMFDAVESALGMPNVVCCHAGMVGAHPVTDYPLAEYDKLMEVNVRAAFVVAQEAARRWIAQRIAGHLIFTTSWVQDVPWPEITPYTMSKSAMKAMMRGFARELAGKGIRANAIAPGIVGVGMAKRQWDTDPSYRARASKAIPLGYMQPPESVADAFAFLCSDMASYMTGATLLVDGGCSLYPMD